VESLESRIALATLMEVKLAVTDLGGNPITSITQGGDFIVRATVEDLRPSPQGVFAAYVDVTYDSSKGAVDGPIAFGSQYPNGREGNASVPSQIDEVGAFDGFFPIGGGPKHLFSVPFTATNAGALSFNLDPADLLPQHNVLLFGISGAIDPADIRFVNATIDVQSAGPKVEVKLSATDLLGNPITTIAAGSDFLLQATVEDLRSSPQGVFASYVDVSYDAFKAVVDGPITYGADYPNGREGDASIPGFIDEVGAFDGFFPLGGGPKHLFTVPFTATNAGILDFSLDPADILPQHNTLLVGINGLVDPADIRFVNDSLEVFFEGPQVEVTLTATDLAGNPITSIQAGADFLLQATVQDLRPFPQGVFAAYADITFDPARALVDGPITYGPDYPNGQSGDSSSPGLIDEAGAFDGFFPLGGSPRVLFVVPMTATAAGTLDFVLDPADILPDHNILVFGSNSPVPAADVRFVNDSLEVQPAPNTVVVAGGVLVVTGGDQADQVTITQSGSQLVVTASFLPGGVVTFPAASITSINVAVGGANDTVVVSATVTQPARIDGGAGNDTLIAGGGRSQLVGGDGNDTLLGGSAPSILQGGAGNDTIMGGAGRNVIIGGTGADTILAGGGDDLLISGTTSFDQNDAALNSILDEWTSSRTYADRAANLRNGTGPVLSGTGISLQKGVSVLDDASADLLIGGADSDWFLYDLLLDLALDKSPTEAAN